MLSNISNTAFLHVYYLLCHVILYIGHVDFTVDNKDSMHSELCINHVNALACSIAAVSVA